MCSIDPMDAPEAPAAEPSQPIPVQQPGTTNDFHGKRLVPRDEYMAAFADVEAPDFEIAPLGADLQDEYADVTPLPIDLSALSLAPAGSDMGELKREVPDIVPDISHLKLQDE